LRADNKPGQYTAGNRPCPHAGDWQVNEHIRRIQLTVLLQKFRLSAYDINALYPERRFVPQKVKRLIDSLKDSFTQQTSK
jgi:hypothetical protein